MVHSVIAKLYKTKALLLGGILALALLAAAGASVATASPAYAAACDKVNIVYCGLDGTDAASYINSFQAAYQTGSNAGHDDLKTVYRWAGATNSSVVAMDTSNTKIGTLYRNGDIKVNGVVVGHDSWVAARYGDGRSGFVQVSPGVWARKTTTDLQQDTYKVIVHMDASGNADFAIMVDCGNAVKFTPVQQPKPPQPALACVSLTQSPTGSPLMLSFTATASAVATTIQSYTFTFSGGGVDDVHTINTSATNITITHTFPQNNTAYTVSAVITGKSAAGATVTAPTCQLSITTPKPQECKPGIPVGDARCNECKPGVPVGDSRCTECKPGVPAGSPECVPTVTPAVQTLVNTGPGSLAAVFGVTTAAGGLARYMFIRRKLSQ